MITFILTATGDAATLGQLLAALVPGVVEGVVHDVAVVGTTGASEALADDAGAGLYPAGGFGKAVGDAKGDWIAALPLAAQLASDWIEQLADHMAAEAARPARLIAPGLLSFGPEGWLVPRTLVPSVVAGEQDLQRLARRGGVRLALLRRG